MKDAAPKGPGLARRVRDIEQSVHPGLEPPNLHKVGVGDWSGLALEHARLLSSHGSRR
jgi:hypothetical protein